MKAIFEWDESKARINLEKHKISFEEASTIFADPSLVTFVDDFHSDKELARSKIIKRVARGRCSSLAGYSAR